jgi:alpha-beta hydrolase superfamily lysophospholipase
MRIESVSFRSLGDEVVGSLFWPGHGNPAPVLIVCHGAGEFKENYFEMCEQLVERGLAALAIDMHGHGQSGGQRFYVKIDQWVADIRAAIDFLTTCSEVDGQRIGAFGLSSGGTAILEAGLVEPRLKVLIGLDPTVRNCLSVTHTAVLKLLTWFGKVKSLLSGKDFRLPLAKLSVGPKMASDPQVNRRLKSDPKCLEAFLNFPLPGGEQAFFVDTMSRVSQITAPTLVLWGEDDELDPPATGQMLYEALRCKKQIRVIPGNGHAGHLDRNRSKVFESTADWMLENLQAQPARTISQKNFSNAC